MANSVWQTTLDQLKQQLDSVRVENVFTHVADPVREAFRKAEAEKWPNDRKVFTYGQLDVDKMILLCREGIVPWWPVFTARVFFGDLDGMNKVRDAFTEDRGQGAEPGMSSALTWITFPNDLTDGFSNKIDAKVIRQLLDWGADPNHEKGAWFEKVLRNLDAEAISAYLDHGASPATAFRVLGDLQKSNSTTQAAKVLKELEGRTLYAKLDDQTLCEMKHVPGPDGGGALRTLFNFRARRVNEIYEFGRGASAVMNAVPFADYDPEALRLASEKLTQLGGAPRPFEDALDKPKKPRLEPQNG